MFNFSANHIKVQSSIHYAKCTVYTITDIDTRRCYKVYDYLQSNIMLKEKIYCISGKVNSADKLYLLLEHFKEDKQYYSNNILNSQGSTIMVD